MNMARPRSLKDYIYISLKSSLHTQALENFYLKLAKGPVRC